jgi:hypothetical protein
VSIDSEQAIPEMAERNRLAIDNRSEDDTHAPTIVPRPVWTCVFLRAFPLFAETRYDNSLFFRGMPTRP